MNEKTKVLLMVLMCTFLWGAGYPVVKLSYKYFSLESIDIPAKIYFAGIRFLIAGFITFTVTCILKKRFVTPKTASIKKVFTLAVFQTTLQYMFTYIGLVNTTGSKSSVLNQLNVFLLVLMTPLIFKSEKLKFSKVAGCVVGFIGIVIINLNGLSFNFNYGDGFIVLASISAAVGYLISKVASKDEDAIVITAFQQLIGGAILLIIGYSLGGRLTTINIYGGMCLLFLSIAASASYSIWSMLLKHNDVSAVSIYKFMTPVFGVTMSGLLLGENILTIPNFIALLFVCTGIFIVNRKLPS